MNASDAVNGENIQSARGPSRDARVSLKTVVITAFVVSILLAVLHFSGLIPINRVPRILTAPFRPPQRADTANPILYKREQFTFSYPRNWRIDTASEHHDPDAFLILDAPRRGQVRLQILAVETDPKEMAEQVAARFDLPGLRVDHRSEFSRWGQLNGHGLRLLGEKLGEPFQVRIFAHSGTTHSLVVWEYWWDGADSINATGFKFIEDTFRFSAVGPEAPALTR
jgi:hypothetical protein